MISIHAPVKGATDEKGNQTLYSYNFNPRAREGRDLSEVDEFLAYCEFQSTRP